MGMGKGAGASERTVESGCPKQELHVWVEPSLNELGKRGTLLPSCVRFVGATSTGFGSTWGWVNHYDPECDRNDHDDEHRPTVFVHQPESIVFPVWTIQGLVEEECRSRPSCFLLDWTYDSLYDPWWVSRCFTTWFGGQWKRHGFG